MTWRRLSTSCLAAHTRSCLPSLLCAQTWYSRAGQRRRRLQCDEAVAGGMEPASPADTRWASAGGAGARKRQPGPGRPHSSASLLASRSDLSDFDDEAPPLLAAAPRLRAAARHRIAPVYMQGKHGYGRSGKAVARLRQVGVAACHARRHAAAQALCFRPPARPALLLFAPQAVGAPAWHATLRTGAGWRIEEGAGRGGGAGTPRRVTLALVRVCVRACLRWQLKDCEALMKRAQATRALLASTDLKPLASDVRGAPVALGRLLSTEPNKLGADSNDARAAAAKDARHTGVPIGGGWVVVSPPRHGETAWPPPAGCSVKQEACGADGEEDIYDDSEVSSASASADDLPPPPPPPPQPQQQHQGGSEGKERERQAWRSLVHVESSPVHVEGAGDGRVGRPPKVPPLPSPPLPPSSLPLLSRFSLLSSPSLAPCLSCNHPLLPLERIEAGT